MMGSQNRYVIVIPCLNEEEHIETVVKSLQKQTDIQIWIYDGGSSDRTVEIVSNLSAESENLYLFQNPRKTQSAAVNDAASRASEEQVDYLIRVDAHARYELNFIKTITTAMQRWDVDAIVVPLITVGGNKFQDASADVFNSKLGNGGSPHRGKGKSGLVEHGHHAVIKVSSFIEAGGYREELRANEDADLDAKLIMAGKKIFLENQSPVSYIPRKDPISLWKQYFRNGYYRLSSSVSLRKRPNLRQVLPAALSLLVCGGILLAPVSLAYLIPAAGYFTAVAIASALSSTQKGISHILRMVIVAVIAHMAFGLGYNTSIAVECSRWIGNATSPRRAKT